MRWSDVRAALDALLALPAAEQPEHLDALARREPELAAELRELLAHDRAAERESSFLSPSRAAMRASDAPPPHASIGPYELQRQLGSGGMGVVYLARRADGAYERRVAVKVILRELVDERVLERFRRERQVLANLGHPGIARMIDGGETEAGTPYLVMEYVEGVPIDRFCDTERLSLRARVELFLKVCDAVQHAHEHLVVHRDLKPRNILVTASGDPKLLDFGIAKILDPEKNSAAPEVTIGVVHFMTPAYASPEQVSGRPILTSSDVYSLGVVLYELLTGSLPYRVETTSAVEIERIVCGTEPMRLRDALLAGDAIERARVRMTHARGLARALAGDLDRIVLKALRKETRLRYASVERFADDLRRYLAGLPVSARSDTFLYRASKFVRRNRTGVAAVATVFLALSAGLVATLIQYRRAEDLAQAERGQRQLAEERLAQSRGLAADLVRERTAAQERVVEVEALNRELEDQRALSQRRFEDVHGFTTRLIFDLYGALYVLEGATQAREFVLETGLAYLDRLAAESPQDFTLQRELAHTYLRVAEVQGGWSVSSNLGQLEDALRSADKAVAIGEALLRSEPQDLRNPYTLASARCARAGLLRVAGRENQALAEYDAALEVARPLVSDPRSNDGQVYVTYFAMVKRAEILSARVQPSELAGLYKECEALVERIAQRFGSQDSVAELAVIRALIARAEHGLDTGSTALDRGLETLESLEALARARPNDALIARQVRSVRGLLAPLLAVDGGADWALDLLQTSAVELDGAVRADPADFQAQSDLVDNARNRMAVLIGEGRAREALAIGEAQLALAQRLVEHAPLNALARLRLAQLLCDLGSCRLTVGLALEAGGSLAQARDLLDALAARDPSMVEVQRARVRVYAELGRAQFCAARDLGEDDEVGRRSLAGAVERLAQALAIAQELDAAGVPGLVPGPAELRAELARCRAGLHASE